MKHLNIIIEIVLLAILISGCVMYFNNYSNKELIYKPIYIDTITVEK